ncbi:MAG TPA: glucosaminidase domain-containing protein [Bacteroidales bacterium]|nr:glucosaminidase domain-containing protein [Bacteroidales bacterium]
MKSYFIAILLALSVTAYSQSKSIDVREAYIQRYKDIAIREMKRSGIPASITLGQGMLESDNGKSPLAKSSNNHFGIKCHKWTGDKVYHDDDAKGECFRKYKNPEESYVDHTDFLMGTQRYGFLFDYKSTDYKNWAKGLKKAGYATHPQYASMLIKVIEDNNLHYFDQELTASQRPVTHYPKNKRKSADPDFTINLNARPIYQKNNVDYIVVKSGDTFDKISREMEMLSWELLRYNELTKDSVLHEGQILYTQPKRRKAESGKDTHIVKPGETIYSISQLYAIKSWRLLRLNRLSERDTISPGDVLNLRRRKKN